MIDHYCLGFLFSRDLDRVVLVLKDRPLWQAGCWNGLGGHIEPGESPAEAMAREMREEAGITTQPGDWQEYAVMARLSAAPPFIAHVFRCAHPVQALRGIIVRGEDMPVKAWPVDDLPRPILSNIPWLILTALDTKVGDGSPYEVRANIGLSFPPSSAPSVPSVAKDRK